MGPAVLEARTLRLAALSDEAPRVPLHFFHVRKEERARLTVDEALFAARGDVIFNSPYEAHAFAQAFNRSKGLTGAAALRAADVNAMGLIHEVLHAVLALYRQRFGAGPFDGLLAKLRADLEDGVRATAETFVDEFPPPAIFRGERSVQAFVADATDGQPNEQWILEELLLLWIANQNPAYAPIAALISDEVLKAKVPYTAIVQTIDTFFRDQPRFGPDNEDLVALLMAPMRASPHDLMGQLEFMRTRWGMMLGDAAIWRRLLLGIDFVKEEGKWFMRKSHGVGDDLAPRTFRPAYGDPDYEAFSADQGWMPRVVLLAKSTFVWLEQLSRKHKRWIRTLSDIPDEELDILAHRGFTGLWLIGLWKRSGASVRIKHRMGKADAVASAYSLYDYEIADDLGGVTAYENLRDRAARRGIRLASDMVPNHMGIDSRWVMEHPHWFVQSDRPPFPGYAFNGPDLSEDGRAAVQIEDGYWNHSDAAVVFKRTDRATGHVSYIYHGNDGTSMPWNDTAQLDYTKAEVREGVIQTILHVARLFPIIRFDAAMTLAKRHYQRLWFPLPGSGGDIPSRAAYAMTKEHFDSVFPVEFWREVVDRVAREVPETLLLAEAFWMMEGYFVRTLGMHRVYNSAFMNMLKKEENANFRSTLKNVLEYEPQILKRFVNFMNNPDEETAIAQFGRDDKYFGVCTLMCTLPGLPMFGHGQVEGYTEKYGMEFKKPQKDEEPDWGLVGRHEREIFPLLHKRALFSDVAEFTLYDVFTPAGWVDEDVFAYSNRLGGERALVVVHNKYKDTRGWVRMSVGFRAGGGLTQRSLGDALGLSDRGDAFLVFRDGTTGLEFIREASDLRDRGLYVELGAFKYHVFWEMRDVLDTPDMPYRALCHELGGRGVPSIDEALMDRVDRPLHGPLYDALAPDFVQAVLTATEASAPAAGAHLRAIVERLAEGVRQREGAVHDVAAATESAALRVQRIRVALGSAPLAAFGSEPRVVMTLALALVLVEAIDDLRGVPPLGSAARSAPTDAAPGPRAGLAGSDGGKPPWVPAFAVHRLGRAVARALAAADASSGNVETAERRAALVELFAAADDETIPESSRRPSSGARRSLLQSFFAGAITQNAGRRGLAANEFEGREYVSKERLQDFVALVYVSAAIVGGYPRTTEMFARDGKAFLEAAEACGYDVGALCDGPQVKARGSDRSPR